LPTSRAQATRGWVWGLRLALLPQLDLVLAVDLVPVLA
jgi:hypothetical protein